MKMIPLSAREKKSLQFLGCSTLEYSARIVELAIVLHRLLGYKMVSALRHLDGIKEVFAYDAAGRLWTFKGPGKSTIAVNNFYKMKPIDEDGVRNMHGIDEQWVTKIALIVQALWPTLSWKEDTHIRKMKKFADDIENLCRAHNLSLRTNDPNGITIGTLYEEERYLIKPTLITGEYSIFRE